VSWAGRARRLGVAVAALVLAFGGARAAAQEPATAPRDAGGAHPHHAGDAHAGHAHSGHADSAHHHADDAEPGALAIPRATRWLEPGERRRVGALDVGYHDQDGEAGRLTDLADRPLAIAFFYSRCRNNYKCTTTVSRLARLQEALAERGSAERVRLLAISFEPQFDTPERIKRFGADRGFDFGPTARGLQLDPEGFEELLDALNIPVSANGGWVTTHGVQLDLLDAEGRFVRSYHTVAWRTAEVVADLERLVGEISSAAEPSARPPG
jgi:protein SCO1/2